VFFALLTKDHDADKGEIRAMVQRVEEKDYSPPRRERILEWQSQRDFQMRLSVLLARLSNTRPLKPSQNAYLPGHS
jgi:hypothetical protein